MEKELTNEEVRQIIADTLREGIEILRRARKEMGDRQGERVSSPP